MTSPVFPFRADSESFRAFQQLWRDELGQELTYAFAAENLALLAVIGAVARWKRSQTLE